MLVLDTNVLSEPTKPAPCVQVLAWVGTQQDELAITAVSVGELLNGVSMLPLGSRRSQLQKAIEEILTHYPIRLDYTEKAARCYASFLEIARKKGRGLSVEDAMISATCAVWGATLVTRNTRDFDFLPIGTINPWIES